MKKTILLVTLFMLGSSGCDRTSPETVAGSAAPTLKSQGQEKELASSGMDIKVYVEPPQVNGKQAAASPVEMAGASSISCASKNSKCDNLIPLMKKFYTPLNEFEVVGKLEIAPGYMAIVLRGTGPSPADAESGDYMKSESFGVFVVDAADNPVLALDIFPTGRMADYDVKLSEHGDGYLVISGAGSTYGDQKMKRKYFFDIKNRKVQSAFSSGIDVDIRHIVELNGVVYCIGNTDAKTAVIAKIIFPQPINKEIKTVSAIQGEKIETILDAKKDGDQLVLTSEASQYVLANNVWGKIKNPSPAKYQYHTGSGQFIGLPDVSFWVPAYQVQQQSFEIELNGKAHKFLIWNEKISANGRGAEKSGIYEIQGTSVKFHPLPQPSYEQFRRFRLERVEDGYSENDTTLETEISAAQLDGGRIRFGLGFYDGEGFTGVGGIGYFDLKSKKFEITYLKDIAGSSVYSMLVEADTIWLGLGVQPEGAVYPQGIVKVSRKDNSLVRYETPGLVNTIVRIGSTVYAGTSGGVVAFGKDGGAETIKLSIGKDGSYSAMISK